ncbi:transcobalamin-1-like [Polypterus senegalus]|uniref:transcobalamin-1-like n=1 Tax=Polypterus senegalus TaxID=55291 RepID=UPI001966971D|nr:transcobalamin-1-like [Polypterus senegalus]
MGKPMTALTAQVLIDAAKTDKFNLSGTFSVDTGSVAVLALTCLKQFKTIQAFPTLQSRIESTIRKLIAKIQQHKQENGIIGNLYSTGLAAQALIVNQVNFNCNKTIKTILAQVSSGAFDNPMTASQIVPFLGGYTYLNVSSLKCTADQNNLPLPAPTHTSPPSSSSISVQFTVANPFRNSSNSIDVSVLDGSTLLTVMERAAQLDPQHFSFTTQSSVYGPFVTSIQGVAGSSTDHTYWQFLSGTTSLSQGIGDYKPKNGEHLVALFSTY